MGKRKFLKNNQMFSKDLQKDNFLDQLGNWGLHPFINGLRSQGIHEMSDLKKKTNEEIKEIGFKIDMPALAIKRLIEILERNEPNYKTENSTNESNKKTSLLRNEDSK